MRSIARILLAAALPFLAACPPVVERIEPGVFPCSDDSFCDDNNDCTTDTCEAKRCRFVWVENGLTCTDDAGDAGTCGDGVCVP